MINRNGVHLPDTTYDGDPIDWNCSSDSDDSMHHLKAENEKLRELAEKLWIAAEMLCLSWDGPCSAGPASIMESCPLDELCIYGSIQRDMRELGFEVAGSDEIDRWIDEMKLEADDG